MVDELATAHIDDCAESTTAAPHGCPFAAERILDADGRRVWVVEGLEWSVDTYPQISLTQHQEGGFHAILQTPASVVMTGSGLNPDLAPVDFTMECDIVPVPRSRRRRIHRHGLGAARAREWYGEPG